MGKRRDLPASYRGMEERFEKAIERIKDGTPLCPDLAAKAKKEKLRLTVSAVALEAGSSGDGEWKGLSRTLIGHATCRYPKIYNLIIDGDGQSSVSEDLRSINRDLRIQNRDLEYKLKLAVSEMGAMAIRMEGLEKDVVKRVNTALRRQARGENNPNNMPTQSVGENVFPLPEKR
jgi:hypothetical protein